MPDLDALDYDEDDDGGSPIPQASHSSVFHDVRSTLSPESSSGRAGSISSHTTDWHDAQEVLLPSDFLSVCKFQAVAPGSSLGAHN